MIRNKFAKQLDHDPHFRWRGEAVTRIENLSDIVFALALGMLVSASTPPTTYQELMPHLVNIVPVTAGFAIMLLIWNFHFTFFRRYGVADTYIIFLNAALLLFILFIAYPLRFAFDSLFAWILGFFFGGWGRMADMGITDYRQAGTIVAWFSGAQAFVYLILHAMYRHALRKSELLDLNASERAITWRSIWRFRFEGGISLIVALLAAFTVVGPMAAVLGILNWPAAILARKLNKIPDNDSVPSSPQ